MSDLIIRGILLYVISCWLITGCLVLLDPPRSTWWKNVLFVICSPIIGPLAIPFG